MDAELRESLRSATGIAFLCSGNMIRSAFAELYARHVGCPLPVRSGATVYRNDRIYGPTGRELEARGVDPSWIGAFRPTHLDELLPQLDDGTVFFGMKREHLASLPPAISAAPARAFLLSRLLGSDEEIADPMFEGGLETVVAHVARCVDALVAELGPARGPSRPGL